MQGPIRTLAAQPHETAKGAAPARESCKLLIENPIRPECTQKMKSSRVATRTGAAAPSPLAATPASGLGTPLRPEVDENGDDVLPNLLLDVREGFLSAFRSLFREYGITDQQFRVLSILNKAGDLEIGKLARRGRIVAPSMTGILDRLVETGWVTRKASKGQRWGVVALTAAGRRLIMEIQPQADERVAAMQAALGPRQLELLRDLLARTRTVLRDLAASSPDGQAKKEKRTADRRRGTQKVSARPAVSGRRPAARKGKR